MASAARKSEGKVIDIAGMTFREAMYVMNPELLPSNHLSPLIDVIQSIHEGNTEQVIVTVPPRFGKSATIALGTAFLLLNHPGMKAEVASCSQRLADKASTEIRTHVERGGYDFSPDTNRKDLWENRSRTGGLLASGIMTGSTGFGYNLLILDDPIAGREAAESLTIRDSTWSEITDVHIRGLQPRNVDDRLIMPSIIVVQTRWHTDDPTGRFLKGQCERFQSGWKHIHLRPIVHDAEGNERSLWPERWPLEMLRSIRGNGASRTWTSLYQGDPRPQGSSLFGEPTFGEWPWDDDAQDRGERESCGYLDLPWGQKDA